MPTPFAAIEARVNNAVLAHLPNAACTWQAAGGGALLEADGIVPLPYFERTAAGTIEVVEHVRVSQEAWPDAAPGDNITVRGVAYKARSVEPEPAGGIKRINLVPVVA